MMGKTLKRATRSPLSTPAAVPTATASRIETTGEMPRKYCTVSALTMPATATTAPTERSIPRVRMTIIMPTDMMLRMAVFVRRSWMFSRVRKLRLRT